LLKHLKKAWEEFPKPLKDLGKIEGITGEERPRKNQQEERTLPENESLAPKTKQIEGK